MINTQKTMLKEYFIKSQDTFLLYHTIVNSDKITYHLLEKAHLLRQVRGKSG
jgi:hypothetical protein